MKKESVYLLLNCQNSGMNKKASLLHYDASASRVYEALGRNIFCVM